MVKKIEPKEESPPEVVASPSTHPLVQEQAELLDLLDILAKRGLRDESAIQARLSVVNRDIAALK